MIRKALLAIAAIVLVLSGVLVFNAFRFESKQESIEPVALDSLRKKSLERFQKAIQYQTISYGDSTRFDSTAFVGFRNFLSSAYPLVHAAMSREVVGKYSLLYHWEGVHPELRPVILMAHQDVVPIEEATRSRWTNNPFGGIIRDNAIWGRGTADDKINLIAILEAIEKLLAQKFSPDRTLYLAFGHDEELGGKGAVALAELLKSRGVKADMVLDEGGIITTDKIPQFEQPVALLGTSEKGYMSLELTVEKTGGHSSQPDAETAIDILLRAVERIRENPFDSDLSESTKGFLEYLGPEMPFSRKVVFANPWLFSGVIKKIYESTPSGNAIIRTTAVTTIISAGVKDNVIPAVANATVNFRLLPGDKGSDIIERVKRLIADDRVKVSIHNGFLAEASKVSPVDGYGFKHVSRAVRESIPQAIVAPFLMIGGTDSRHFGEISDNIIKFSPMVDPEGYRGIDEHVSLESYRLAIGFYERLIRNLN